MDTIEETLSPSGDTVETYLCQRVTANNVLVDLVVPYYYDLIYPCAEEPSEGRDFVAAALLARAKRGFLPDGNSCVRPQNPWFAKLSSLPEDEFADFPCQQLTADCCVVVQGSMTFTQLSSTSLDAMKQWVASNLNDSEIAPGYQVAFIGSELAPGFGQVEPELPDAIVSDEKGPTPVIPAHDSEFTMVGVLILVGMVLLFLTVVMLIFKRRQVYLTQKDLDEAIAQSESGPYKKSAIEAMETATWEDRTFDDQEPDIEVNVVSNGDPYMHIRSVSSVSYRTRDGRVDDLQNSAARQPHLNQHYRFDLASHNKNDVLGTYGADLFGPTEITVVPPYPMEETSESEADSWAQTDGTVGSLDDEPIPGDPNMEIGEI